MKNESRVREDLERIKRYYLAASYCEKRSKLVTANDFKVMLEKYKSVIQTAPKRLQEVFNGIYVYGKTQKTIAEELSKSEGYIQILHKRLIRLFIEKLY